MRVGGREPTMVTTKALEDEMSKLKFNLTHFINEDRVSLSLPLKCSVIAAN